MLSNYKKTRAAFEKMWNRPAPDKMIGDPRPFDMDSENEVFFQSYQRLVIKKEKGNLIANAWTSDHSASHRPLHALNLIYLAGISNWGLKLPDFKPIRIYTGDISPTYKCLRECNEYPLIPGAMDLNKISPDFLGGQRLANYTRQSKKWPRVDMGFDEPNLFLNKDFGICPDFTFWAYSGAYMPSADGVSGWANFHRDLLNKKPSPNPSPRIGWRGSCQSLSAIKEQTAQNPNFELWNGAPRLGLRELSREHPDIIDAKCPNQEGSQHRLTPIELRDNYKYLLEAGGGGCSCRVKWLLCLKRLCFIREKAWSAFYEINLKPYVHYIPIKEDFSDLIEKYHWAEDNPEKCEEIIDNCSTFVERFLSPKSLAQRWHDTIHYIVENYQ